MWLSKIEYFVRSKLLEQKERASKTKNGIHNYFLVKIYDVHQRKIINASLSFISFNKYNVMWITDFLICTKENSNVM